jgi:hypothetical protein
MKFSCRHIREDINIGKPLVKAPPKAWKNLYSVFPKLWIFFLSPQAELFIHQRKSNFFALIYPICGSGILMGGYNGVVFVNLF